MENKLNQISTQSLTVSNIVKTILARTVQLSKIFLVIILLQKTLTNENLQFINESWYFRIPFWLLLLNFAGISFSLTINKKKYKLDFIDTLLDKFQLHLSLKNSSKFFKIFMSIYATILGISLIIFMFYAFFTIIFMSQNLNSIVWFLFLLLKIQIVMFIIYIIRLILFKIKER